MIQIGTVKDDQEPITWDVEAMQAGRPQPSPWSRQMMSPSQRASLDAMDEPLDVLLDRLTRYMDTPPTCVWMAPQAALFMSTQGDATPQGDGCEEPDA